MSRYGNLEFINTKYRPGPRDVILSHRVAPARGVSLARAAEYIAGESSIGTWTRVTTMNERIARRLKPSVFSIDEKSGIIKIAYPEELFEPGNIPGLLSSVAGNIYGMKGLRRLRLEDLSLTRKLVKSFPGPRLGVKGVRRLTGVRGRPLFGTIVKPKVGLTAAQHARVAYEAWRGGLDIVKDDENLTSLSFNRFSERVRRTLAARDRAERETGEKKLYLANVTAETEEMKRRALLVKRHGGEYIMIDILTVGWAALQTMRAFAGKHGLAIHAHRAMHAALTRDPRHGISMVAIAKLARLAGVDQLHIGTANLGKMEASKDEVLALERVAEEGVVSADEAHRVLRQDFHGVKPTLAVASGGLSPLAIPKLVERMGVEIIAQFGGGCHGHPLGTRAGARAIRQAWEAVERGATLEEYAKDHKELALALARWGDRGSQKSRGGGGG